MTGFVVQGYVYQWMKIECISKIYVVAYNQLVAYNCG